MMALIAAAGAPFWGTISNNQPYVHPWRDPRASLAPYYLNIAGMRETVRQTPLNNG